MRTAIYIDGFNFYYRGQFWVIEVAACQANAANMQFTRYADRNRLCMPIQNK